MEEKIYYTDSKGKVYLISDMPLIMVYRTIMKYGKEHLLNSGYTSLVDRFTMIEESLNLTEQVNKLAEAMNNG